MIDHEKAALRETVEELSAILRTTSDYLEDVLTEALERGLFMEGKRTTSGRRTSSGTRTGTRRSSGPKRP